ncbi:MAG: hypothetical protein BGO01_16825 [Armatimonadetes bacterium 55-13]|jgi:hypothetical protein|nr:MAG: hypothetical protein BGO01_16825 [Armatimonadetes bacterium 55-13]
MPPDPLKISTNWASIRGIAADRFDAFRRPGDADELDALARYVWNMELCRELQTPLHALEVCFRNRLHNALTAAKGRPDWFNDETLLSLDEQSNVIRAKKTLERLRRPFAPGRVIAELNFGFWTGLYGSDHEINIVRPTLTSTFPHLVGRARRATVASPLREARLLRNRISHHEHICFDVALPSKHAQIITLIQWMSPEIHDVVAISDQFGRVYGATWTAYRPVLETLFG